VRPVPPPRRQKDQPQTVVTAIARELAGFVWAEMTVAGDVADLPASALGPGVSEDPVMRRAPAAAEPIPVSTPTARAPAAIRGATLCAKPSGSSDPAT